jgi:hypothetical protein
MHEPRPSWAASFVRRMLEADGSFDVSSFSGASKGLTVTAGDAPARLAGRIDVYDVVAVGAPEELSAADVEALTQFARRRGGSIVLLPDRRPSGPYLALLQAREFDELLVEKPIVVTNAGGGSLRASELATPRGQLPLADVYAAAEQGNKRTPVVFGWPMGDGRVIFSGALDAWRFRAAGEDDFKRFWADVFAGAALSAPDRIDLTIAPGIARPGDEMAIRMRLRASEIDEQAGRVRAPAVRARLISASGAQEMIRLWPGDVPGSFYGRVTASAAGQYDLQVSTDGASADAVVIVSDDARRPPESSDRQRAIAAASGGVTVDASDLTPLVQSVLSLPAPQAGRDVHPARSLWFVVAFASLLCAEWTLRRRAGLR